MTKLSIINQIGEMESKGIKFDIFNKEDTEIFLLYNTYYTKILSYAQNYPIIGEEKYYGLEFAFLVELSTLDMYIRRFVIRLCLDIEHSLKTQIMRDCYENENEDGYEIVNLFLKSNPFIKEKIDDEYDKIIKKQFQCTYLDQIYINHYPNFSLWEIVEILTLGDFSILYSLYYDNNDSFSYSKFLQPVRKIRNICAHNSCLIDSLKMNDKNQITPTREITSFLGSFMGQAMKRKVETAVIHDLTSVFYLFDKIVKSKKMKEHTYREALELLNNRIIYKKEYFNKQDNLKSAYNYFHTLVTHLYNNSKK